MICLLTFNGRIDFLKMGRVFKGCDMHYLHAWLLARMPENLAIALICVLALAIGFMAARLILMVVTWLVSTNTRLLTYVSLKRLRPPLFTLVPVYCVFLALRLILPTALDDPFFSGLMKLASVGLMYWLLIRIIDSLGLAITRHYDINVKDNLHARQIHTQILVIRRIAFFLITLAALVSVFLLFDTLRGLGVSLLASAGVAGIVIGLAAQKTLGNLFSGIQIAFTQPIRIEDVVVVEGEWGWIEEINLTYVVVRLWDLRRQILPISYFIDKPFTNWTRTSSNIIGTVMLYVDYSLPLDPLRAELKRLLAGSMQWDGKTEVVQAIDCDKDIMKVRILVSSVDAPTSGELCNFIRERLIGFICQNYPACLPRVRALVETHDHRDIRPA